MHPFQNFILTACLIISSSWAHAADKIVLLGTNRVSYSVSGSSSNTVVLIHGWGGKKEQWQPQISNLDRNFRVIAIDLPGYGQSDKPKTNYTMAFKAAAVQAALQEVKAAKAVLVGFSMGAQVISEFYKQHPEQVAGLVSIDGTLRGLSIPPDRLEEMVAPYRTGQHEAPLRQFFGTMFPNPGTEKLRDEVIETLLKTPAYVLQSSFEQMADASTWKVSKISVPLLMIKQNNPAWSEEEYVKQLQPKAIYKEMPGVGHFIHLEKPSEVNALLNEFLNSVFSSPNSR